MKVHRTRSVRGVEVTTDGKNLVSHAGTALLCELADRTGLTRAMSQAMADCGISWHTHDPGVVLTHLAVAIADGADCLTDFAVLGEAPELFGDVASVSTAWRAVKKTTSLELRRIPAAAARAREVVWAAAPPGDITIDRRHAVERPFRQGGRSLDLQAGLRLLPDRGVVRHDERAARGAAAPR